MSTPLTIDADFAGGNIFFDRVEGDTVHVRQDLRDTAGHWFYWYFRVRGATGRKLRFEFNDRNVIGVHGPAISTDGGRSWRWLGAGSADPTGFTHRFGEDEEQVRFAMGVPYVQSDLNRWLSERTGHRRLVAETLCLSRGGAAVPMLRVDASGEARHGVLLTCWHHCCEAMASFALEGLLDAMLGNDEMGRWYAANVMAVAIPMMDYDGVQAGDQGKNRQPHDHNRDYGPNAIYPEVRALQELVGAWPGEGVTVDLDLHCPWLRGLETNQRVYLVGSRDAGTWEHQRKFAAILEQLRRGPIEYSEADNLPFGKSWNTQANEGQLISHTRWMEQQRVGGLVTTVEIPYADVKGRAISAEDVRLLGRDLAVALMEYLIAG